VPEAVVGLAEVNMQKARNKPRVSIGMPVYNGECYLSETIDSLLGQTFAEFELTICDNASTDQTEEICRTYASADARIRYVRHATNLGAGQNYRCSFQLSSGEYFRWANCDDLFALESLERCVEVLDGEPSVVLTYPQTRLIDEKGQIIADYKDGLHLQSNTASERFTQLHEKLGFVNAIYGLMRTNVLRHTGLIGDYLGADRVLLAELALYGKFWEIPQVLFYRRLHPGAYSSKTDKAELLKFYNPNVELLTSLTKWRQLWENHRAVQRAPLDINEKVRLLRYIARMANWSRGDLLAELAVAARQFPRGLFRYALRFRYRARP
jgi:glycosyltransferase involved in cell wall biosynthesis